MYINGPITCSVVPLTSPNFFYARVMPLNVQIVPLVRFIRLFTLAKLNFIIDQ
jgi:hypothetical protein